MGCYTDSPEDPQSTTDDDGSGDDTVAHQFLGDEVLGGVPWWLHLHILINWFHAQCERWWAVHYHIDEQDLGREPSE